MPEATDDTLWKERPWYIVGCGRLGKALGLIANRMGIEVRRSWNRTREAATETGRIVDVGEARSGDLSDESGIGDDITEDAVVWLTVADDALEEVTRAVGPRIPASAIVLHPCGSRGPELLATSGVSGERATAHPLWPVSDPTRAAEELGDATWTVEGTRGAVTWLRRFLHALGAEWVEFDGLDRELYHAAAVVASNLMVGTLEAAVELAEAVGMSRAQAHAALWPLARSALENMRDEMSPDGLTGPVARGDETTVERHLRAIEATGDEGLGDVYRVLTIMCRRLID